MSIQLDSRSRKPGPSGDIPVPRTYPQVVIRKRPAIRLDDMVEINNAVQERVVAEQMAEIFLQAVGDTTQDTASIPATSSSADGSAQPPVPPTENDAPGANDNGQNSNNDNSDGNENNDNNDEPTDTHPPDTTAALPSGSDKSQIPCRYHGLPGGYLLNI